MICFLCKREYDHTNRGPVVDIMDSNGELIHINYIQDENQKIFRLCPDCTRAVVFGNMMAGGSLAWCGEIEYEE